MTLTSTGSDKVGVLRAGILFKSKTGRAPRRRDFRPPDKQNWENTLALELPSADMATKHFGSWSEYVSALGYEPKKKLSNELIEQSALSKVRELYPDFEEISANTSSFDGYIGSDRTEIKGSTLSFRQNVPNTAYFAFRTHSRQLDKTCDRLVCVGLGWDNEKLSHVPLVVLDFQKSALGLVSNKSVVMIYASSLYAGGHSLYSPYVVWRADVSPSDLHRLTRSKE